VTLPRAGFFEYRTGRLETIFAEDFEGTPTGWTTAGSGNEWQFGQPQGRSGTSLGLAWADPSAAAEGSRAAGVDLGLPGQGAYEWFSNQTLTSPPIDLRGRTAPVLRFARWLSISALDTATLTANGQTLFTSSAENESAWTTVEYDLSAFAGQTVTLRWTLASLLPFQAGGWNIDEVRVTSFSSSAAPPVELRVLPEQIPLGTPATLSIQGAPAAPIALLLSTTPGPLTIPGLGTLFVGGQIEVLPTALDGSGQLTAGFQGPTDPSAIGTFAYAQVLQVRGGTLELSNGMILLFAN
jgi:bacillopeptidase F